MVRGIRSRILVALSRHPQGVSARALAKETGYQPSTILKVTKYFRDNKLAAYVNPQLPVQSSVSLHPLAKDFKPASTKHGAKPLVSTDDGKRIALLIRQLDQSMLHGRPMDDTLTDNDTLMRDLAKAGLGPKDITDAQNLGIIEHKEIPVIVPKHTYEFGYQTPTSIHSWSKPDVKIRHVYRFK
jgi:hypothetical protein